MFINKDIGEINSNDEFALETLISKYHASKLLVNKELVSKEKIIDLIKLTISNNLGYNYGASKPQEYDNGNYEYVKIYKLQNPSSANWKSEQKLQAEVRRYDSRIVVTNPAGIDEKIIDFIKSGFSHPFNTKTANDVTRWNFFSVLWYFGFRGEPMEDYST